MWQLLSPGRTKILQEKNSTILLDSAGNALHGHNKVNTEY